MSHLKWVLCLTLPLVLFACGGDDPAPDSPAATPDGGPEAAEADPGATNLTDTAGDIVDKVEDTAASAIAEADSLIEKITSYVEGDKLDLAKTALAKLEGLADQLPASYQDKIAKVRSLIEAAGLGDKAKKLTEGLGFGGD